MSLVFVLMEVQTRYAIGIFGAIARCVRTPGGLSLGFLVFAFAGVVVWPLLHVVLEDHLPRGPDPAHRGMVLGACLWVPFVVTARGDLEGPLVLVYVAVSLLAHLRLRPRGGVRVAHRRQTGSGVPARNLRAWTP